MSKSISVRSPLRYPGGKFRARNILEKYVPSGTRNIVSPFIGGASFELYMTDKDITVEGYDIFWLLANFWDMLLIEPEEIANRMEDQLGKITKEIFLDKQHRLAELEKNEHDSISLEQRLDAASDFIIVNRCSFSASTLSGGFSNECARERFTQSNIDKVRNFNNPNIHISCKDVFSVLDNTDGESLLFLDPPYMLDNNASCLYGISGNLHRGFDHERFYEMVDSIESPFILTYNDSPEVRKLWSKYKIDDASWSYGMNQSKKSKEIIITGRM